MTRVSTLVDEVLRRRASLSDLNQLSSLGVVLSKMRAQPTLTSMDRYHSTVPYFVISSLRPSFRFRHTVAAVEVTMIALIDAALLGVPFADRCRRT
jgi:hypothetical protein